MAGIARDRLSSFEVIPVDRFHHRHHLARHLLHGSARFAIRQMTVVAGHAQRRLKKLHRRDQLVGRRALHHLDVLVNCFGLSTRKRRVLRERARDGKGHSQHADC